MRRAHKALLVLLGSVGLLAFSARFLAERVLRTKLEQTVARAGRTLELGALRVRAWPLLHVELERVRILAPEQQQPLFSVQRALVEIPWRSLLWDRAPVLHRVQLDTPVLAWEFSDRRSLSDEMRRWRPAQPTARNTSITLEALQLTHGALWLRSEGRSVRSNGGAIVEEFSLSIPPEPPHGERILHTRARVLGSDLRAEATVRTGPIQRDPLERAHFDCGEIALTELASVAAAAGLRADWGAVAGAVSGTITATRRENDVPLLRGEIRLLRVRPPWRARALNDVHLQAEGSVSARQRWVDVRSLTVRSGELSLQGNGRFQASDGAFVLALQSNQASVQALLPWMPEGALERIRVQADGPFSLAVRAHSQGRELSVDAQTSLDALSLQSPLLVKPAGITMRASVRGTLAEALQITDGSLQFASHEWLLRNGSVALERQEVRGLLRLHGIESLGTYLPSVRERMAGIHGNLQAELSLLRQRATNELQVGLTLGANQVSLQRADAQLQGSLGGSVTLTRTPEHISGTVALNATELALMVGEVLQKTRGTQMRLRTNLRVAGTSVETRAGVLELPGLRSAFELGVQGENVSVRTGETTIEPQVMSRWLVPLRERVPSELRDVNATLQGSVTVHRRAGTFESTLSSWQVRGSAGNLQGTASFDGGGASAQGRFTLRGEVHPRALGARASAVTMEHVAVQANGSLRAEGGTITFREGIIEVPGLRFEGGVAFTPHRGQVQMTPSWIGVRGDALRSLLASAPEALAGLTARARVDANFNRNEISQGQLHVTELTARGSFGTLLGSLSMEGLSERGRLRYALQAPRLVAPAGTSGGAAAGVLAVPLWFRSLDASGSVRVTAFEQGPRVFENIELDSSLQQGTLAISRLRFRLANGSFVADGSQVRAQGEELLLQARVRSDYFRIERAFPPEPGASRPASTGLLAIEVSLDSHGNSAASLQQALQGRVRIALHDAHLTPPARPRIRVRNPVLSRFASGATRNVRPPQIHVRRAQGIFSIDQGHYRTVEPLDADTEYGTVTLRGEVTSERNFTLEGNIELDPTALLQTSRGRLAPEEAIPLSLRLRGVPGDVEIELVEPTNAIASFVRARIRALIGGPAATHPQP